MQISEIVCIKISDITQQTARKADSLLCYVGNKHLFEPEMVD